MASPPLYIVFVSFWPPCPAACLLATGPVPAGSGDCSVCVCVCVCVSVCLCLCVTMLYLFICLGTVSLGDYMGYNPHPSVSC